MLILGNHDVQHQPQLRYAGFRRQYWGAILSTDPLLALTHLPLKRRPVPAVNVHGHIHGADAPSARHANVSVEKTDYRPKRLDELLAQIERTRRRDLGDPAGR